MEPAERVGPAGRTGPGGRAGQRRRRRARRPPGPPVHPLRVGGGLSRHPHPCRLPGAGRGRRRHRGAGRGPLPIPGRRRADRGPASVRAPGRGGGRRTSRPAGGRSGPSWSGYPPIRSSTPRSKRGPRPASWVWTGIPRPASRPSRSPTRPCCGSGPACGNWIDEDREALLALGHLREAAASWVELDRDPGALYRGARLQVALDVTEAHADHLGAGGAGVRRRQPGGAGPGAGERPPRPPPARCGPTVASGSSWW